MFDDRFREYPPVKSDCDFVVYFGISFDSPGFVVLVIFYGFTTGFTTIMAHHLRKYVWFTFSIRILISLSSGAMLSF